MVQAKAMLDSGMNAEDMVNQEFEELYPGKVQRTQVVYGAKVCSQLNQPFKISCVPFMF